MQLKSVARFVLLVSLSCLNGTMAAAQFRETVWEARPKVVSAVDLWPRTRLETWLESQSGLDFFFQRWRTGSLISRRMKPILNLHLRDIDEDNDHYLVIGGGYEYLHTVLRGRLTNDNSIIAHATPHILLAGLLLSDRNRMEFRWINGLYDSRYRNRITINRQSQVGALRFAPYAYGEVFYNYKTRLWNHREYAAGLQFPYKSQFMLDTYFLRESCTGCSLGSVNMIGVTLNLYLRQISSP